MGFSMSSCFLSQCTATSPMVALRMNVATTSIESNCIESAIWAGKRPDVTTWMNRMQRLILIKFDRHNSRGKRFSREDKYRYSRHEYDQWIPQMLLPLPRRFDLQNRSWQVFWLTHHLGAFPFHLGWNSGFMPDGLLRAYSSGDCLGFTPNSLLRWSLNRSDHHQILV